MNPDPHRDPNRPSYHLLPPAFWLNDPNGAIEHEGWYHIFYLYTPDEWQANAWQTKTWNAKVWGHARSRDLVRWEHEPIAIAPDTPGMRCMSGSVAIRNDGTPILLYSYQAADCSGRVSQRLAIGSNDLREWTLPSQRPVLEAGTQGVPDFGADWRDPFVFRYGGGFFATIGGVLDGEPVLPLFRATDASLSHWEYQGILFRGGSLGVRFLECPKLFTVAGRWVLLISPFGPVRYLVGDIDAERMEFVPTTQGILDHGPCFYAAENLDCHDGRRYVVGWIPGWNSIYHIGKGWNGAISLPREVSLGPDGRLRQRPVHTLASLRGAELVVPPLPLCGSALIAGLAGSALELEIAWDLGRAVAFSLLVQPSDPDRQPLALRIGREGIRLGTHEAPWSDPGRREGRLTMFIDHSIIEIFADDGAVCLTLMHDKGTGDYRFSTEVSGASVDQLSLSAWTMQPGR